MNSPGLVLAIQIPCLNEEETLPLVLQSIPGQIRGISRIIKVVVDDGSTDRTSEVARELGVDIVVRNTQTLGLAFTFRRALDLCLQAQADIIVNMDGDNQYRGDQIERLITPILEQKADMVIGERAIELIEEFSLTKKFLQRIGSWVVRKLASVPVKDATSGFRAMTRETALRLTILSNFTYTLESILQAKSKGVAIVGVPIEINPKTRESRLMRSMRHYLLFSTATILRIFSMYNPLRIFLLSGGISILLGAGLVARFLYFYFTVGGAGKIQSLIVAAILLLQGVFFVLVGILADLIQFNRRLTEETLLRVKRLEYLSTPEAEKACSNR